MTDDEKQKFDSLNSTSYLLRVSLSRLGFDIQCLTMANYTTWHVYYRKTIIGAITFRETDTGFTYSNVRLYKYFSQKFPKLKDFIMSEYYEMEDDKPVKFLFDKFEKYFNNIKECAESLIDNKEEQKTTDELSDSISRLKEYCDEFDSDFSNNIMFKDIKKLLEENDRLTVELEKYKVEAERDEQTAEDPLCADV